MATVLIPLFLSDVTGGVRKVEVEGVTLAEIAAALEDRYPGMAARIHNDGRINPNVALTVDGKIAMRGLDTAVGPDSEVNILPAMGGG